MLRLETDPCFGLLLLRAHNKMPREPRCGQHRSDARKADEAIPRAVWPGGLTRQMGGFRRNPKGRRIFCRMPALLGLDDPFSSWIIWLGKTYLPQGLGLPSQIGQCQRGRLLPRALACVNTCGVAVTGHFVRGSNTTVRLRPVFRQKRAVFLGLSNRVSLAETPMKPASDTLPPAPWANEMNRTPNHSWKAWCNHLPNTLQNNWLRQATSAKSGRRAKPQSQGVIPPGALFVCPANCSKRRSGKSVFSRKSWRQRRRDLPAGQAYSRLDMLRAL